jgi:TonB-linked SusC/RagA family outer membrane protein
MKKLYPYVGFFYKRKLSKLFLIMKLTGLLSLVLSFNLVASVSSQDINSPDLNEKNVLNLQQIIIEGTVTDAATGEPLPGATVQVVGTSRGVVSDMEGKYSIEASPGDALLFSFVGYISEEYTVGDQNVINVSLDEGIQSLEEIVVVGYGTQKRLEVTGAISSVGSEDITAIPVATADQALQGRAAGVYVVNNGSPGTAPSIRIRGLSTVNQNDPLYVIDGVVAAGLGDLNPNDIESFQVLKDASTAAIYGSLGSNGVILVTTKKGTGQKVQVDFDAYWGSQWNNNRYDLLNTEQYIQYASSPDVTTTPPVITDPQYASRLQGETDWQDQVYQSGFMQNYNLVVSGGGKNSNYRVSGGYVDQDGIIRTLNYKRYNFRANSNFTNGRLRLGENLAVAFTDQVPLSSAGGRSILEHAIKMAPYLPVYNENNLGGYQGPSSPIDGQDAENPVRILELFDYSVKTRSIIGNVYGELELVDGLTFRSVAGLEDIALNDDQFYPQFNDDDLGFATHARATALTRKNSATYTSLIFTNSLTYSKIFADAHDIEILALVESSTIDNAITNASSENAITSEVDQLGNTSSNIRSQTNEYSRIGYLGRINYNYKQKYLLAASYRADASSRFGANNRWGYFPSVAAGWRINKEAFLADVDLISNLKLRGSWGVAGNDKIGNYQYATTLTSNMNYVIDNAAVVGTTVSGAANPDLKWEETTMTNIGLDLGLWNNQFTMSVEYYMNKSDDLLMSLTTAPSLGIFSGAKSANVGSVETKGFELQIGYNDFEGDLKWSADLNLGTFKNEVVSLGGLKSVSQSQFENEGITRLKVGEPLFYFYGWQFDGIFQSDAEATSYMGGTQADNYAAAGGDFRIVDVAGPEDDEGNPTGPDGEITADDRTNIGNPFPDLTLALNLNATYKGFDLNLFIQGVYGNDVYNTNIYDLEGMPRLFNSGVAVLDRWTSTNPSNTVPRPGVGTNVQVSSRFVEKGSYTRLKNITLGYTVPSGLLGGNVISRLRVYVSAQNIITLTDYSGLDPEVGAYNVVGDGVGFIGEPRKYGSGYPVDNFQNGIDYGAYPMPKSFTAGIQVTF